MEILQSIKTTTTDRHSTVFLLPFCPSHILPRGVAQWLRLQNRLGVPVGIGRTDNAMGLTLFMMWLFDALLCVLFVTVIVGRSKLAWDFAVTVYIINLIVVWTYTGKFPSSILWWCLQVLSAVLLVTLSTYSTRWNELRTTFLKAWSIPPRTI